MALLELRDVMLARQRGSESRRDVHMKEKGISRILSVATAAASALLSINACGTAFPQNSRFRALPTDCNGSACFADDSKAQVAFLSANSVSTRSVNDYLAQCGEQARMVHHEIQNCRAVKVITIPSDSAYTANAP
jgi:hypothetical protein